MEAWNYRNSCCRAFAWCRSSRLQIFFKIGILKNFTNFTGKYLCRSLFVAKLRALRPFLRWYFLENTSGGCFWQWEFWKQCSQETDFTVSQSLKCLLGLRKLRSSKNTEILQDVLVLPIASWKSIFYYEGKKRRLFPYFLCEIIFNCAELFDCAFNFKFWLSIFHIFKHKHKSNIKGARFEFYKKQPLILGTAAEKCSGSKMPGPQLY